MSDTKSPTSYVIERLTTVTVRDYRLDTLKETETEAWVPVDVFTADTTIFRALKDWLEATSEDQRAAGLYRVVENSDGWSGGQFSSHTVKQSLLVEDAPRPGADLDEGAIVVRIA